MSTQVQIRRGNTAQTAVFTGVVAELTVDTDKKVVVVHDGTTAGGNPLIKANASITTGQILTSNGSHLLALSNTGTAGVYGNASFIPVVTTDAYGRVSSVTNTAIQSGTTSVSGIVQLTDSISSTSTTTAATPNSVKTAYDYAQSAFTKANQTAQLAFTTVSANGTSLVADANTDTLTITSAVANGIFINANSSTDSIDIGLRTTGVTAGSYGNNRTTVTLTIDEQGRITAASQAQVDADPQGTAVALAIALG